MDTTLTANVRTDNVGKGAARKLRRAGRLPAVLYGRDFDARPVDVDPDEVDNIFRVTGDRNTVVHLEMDGEKVPCLVRDAQRHPLTRELLHLDFYAVEPEQQVQVEVRIAPIGKPLGAAAGGRIRLIARSITVACAWVDIPSTIDIDVTELAVGDFRLLSQLEPPKGCTFVYDHDYNVLECYGKRLLIIEEDLETEGEGEGEEEGEGEGEDGADDEQAE